VEGDILIVASASIFLATSFFAKRNVCRWLFLLSLGSVRRVAGDYVQPEHARPRLQRRIPSHLLLLLPTRWPWPSSQRRGTAENIGGQTATAKRPLLKSSSFARPFSKSATGYVVAAAVAAVPKDPLLVARLALSLPHIRGPASADDDEVTSD